MSKILSYKKRLLNQFGSLSLKTFLDYRCGSGDFIKLTLAQNPERIVGVDSSEKMIGSIKNSSALQNKKIQVFQCDHPRNMPQQQFDAIICHNVLECIYDKIDFINAFGNLLKPQAIFILSHHDFDSVIYNSNDKQLGRDLVHHFADTQQAWQQYCDGQMGRKIPGLVDKSIFGNNSKIKIWRINEHKFEPGYYGFLMAEMLCDIGASLFSEEKLMAWKADLASKHKSHDYYFSIDLVIAKCSI